MPVPEHPIVDALNRPLKDLRLSVTDRCNFRCVYCMPAELFGPDYPFLPKSNILSFEEIARVVGIFAKLGVRKIKITGGEPLLRRDLPELIAQINDIEGIEDIALVTNGSLLKPLLPALKSANLRRITVSLDSLDEDTFAAMNGVGFKAAAVLENIHAALDFGFPVKVNMVVKKGLNDKDILPMARYFKTLGVPLRFIEYMDVGNYNGWKMDHVVPSKEILAAIDKEMPLEPVEPEYYGEVASRYRYKDGKGEVGFISSVTQPFCSTCSRARLSAEGKLYTCLFASEGHCLRTPLRDGASDEELLQLVQQIWNRRNDRYSEMRSNQPPSQKSKVEMSHIGG